VDSVFIVRVDSVFIVRVDSVFIVRVDSVWGCFGICSVVDLLIFVTLKPESCGKKPKS
jgi:hypothetical protein